jgi:hypothetical protein
VISYQETGDAIGSHRSERDIEELRKNARLPTGQGEGDLSTELCEKNGSPQETEEN